MDEPRAVPQEVFAALWRVREEAEHLCAYFHTWWSLANLARPDFVPTMNEHGYFFEVCDVGSFAMTFVSLGKLLDRDTRSLGLGQLRGILCKYGFHEEAGSMKAALSGHEEVVRRVVEIRNKAISHNNLTMTRDDVFEKYGTTPDEIRAFVEAVRTTLNQTVNELKLGLQIIPAGGQYEQATVELLRRLRAGIEHEA